MDQTPKSKNGEKLFSPPSGAEALFLGSALEQLDPNTFQQHSRNNSVFSGRIKKSGSFHTALGSAIDADEFMSCAESAGDLESIASIEDVSHSQPFRPFRIFMEKIDDTISNNSNDIMSSLLKKSSTKKVAPKVAPIELEKKPLDVPPPTKEEPMKVDAAEMVYGKAKGILLWGKSTPVVSFFVGASEAVAGKALGVVGTDLSSVDGKIESELTKFDAGVLTPAVGAIAKILMDVAGKSEATYKHIIAALMKPLGFLIKSEAAETSPEAHTETPEVTAP